MKIDVEDRQFGQVVTLTLDDGHVVSEPVRDDHGIPDAFRAIANRVERGEYDPASLVISRRAS